ncbi:type II toxin-antitoxin system Phd/YefM family antitoxin [Thalassiella azotivora]
MSTRSLAYTKAHFSDVVNSVRTTHERVTVTRNGEAAVVIMAADDLEALEETLALLQDPEAMAALREGERDAASGAFTTMEQLESDLAQRRRGGR